MGSGAEDRIDVCKPCCNRRATIRQLFEREGRNLIISRPMDPIRDNVNLPDSHPYVVVRNSQLWEFMR